MLDGKLDKSVKDPRTFIFGYGRRYGFLPEPGSFPDRTGVRICPGRHLAFASLWINIASILATFEISRATDSAPDKALGSEEQYTGAIVM